MLRRCSFFFAALLMGACLQAGTVAGPVCVPGTLASYVALPITGCMVGVLTVNDFVFTVLGSSGGAVPLTDTQITVAPTSTGLGLSFSSTGFSVTGAESVQYLIGYTWDPSDTIQSMDDVMDPPSAILGFANVTTTGCLNAAFIGPICPTSTVSVTVFDNNGITQFNDSVSFTPVPVLGIRNIIDLQAKGGSASFDSLASGLVVPEPATWLSCATALMLLAARRRRFRSRLDG